MSKKGPQKAISYFSWKFFILPTENILPSTNASIFEEFVIRILRPSICKRLEIFVCVRNKFNSGLKYDFLYICKYLHIFRGPTACVWKWKCIFCSRPICKIVFLYFHVIFSFALDFCVLCSRNVSLVIIHKFVHRDNTARENISKFKFNGIKRLK